MAADFSLLTVLLSAGVSVVTGYVGSLLSFSRQRVADRRVYGLALLAEIKSIERALWRYRTKLDELTSDGVLSVEERERLRDDVRLWRSDLSIYTTNSGRIGIFSTRVAVELIEFYHRIRWLDVRRAEAPTGWSKLDSDQFIAWLDAHRAEIGEARQHSRLLGRLLRREVPPAMKEVLQAGRRRLRRAVFATRRTTAFGLGQNPR